MNNDRILPVNKPMLKVCIQQGEESIFSGKDGVSVHIQGKEYKGSLVEVEWTGHGNRSWTGTCDYEHPVIVKSYLLEEVESKELRLAKEAVEKAKAALQASQDVLNKLKEKQ